MKKKYIMIKEHKKEEIIHINKVYKKEIKRK